MLNEGNRIYHKMTCFKTTVGFMLHRLENMMKLGMCWCLHLLKLLLCFLSCFSFCPCVSFLFIQCSFLVLFWFGFLFLFWMFPLPPFFPCILLFFPHVLFQGLTFKEITESILAVIFITFNMRTIHFSHWIK